MLYIPPLQSEVRSGSQPLYHPLLPGPGTQAVCLSVVLPDAQPRMLARMVYVMSAVKKTGMTSVKGPSVCEDYP